MTEPMPKGTKEAATVPGGGGVLKIQAETASTHTSLLASWSPGIPTGLGCCQYAHSWADHQG